MSFDDRRAERMRNGAVLAVACLGLFMVFLHITQTISTLNAVQEDLRIPVASMVWIPSGYTLVVAMFVLSAGVLADRWGRRRVFLAGAVTMAAGGVLLVFAESFAAVLVGQMIAGLGGALLTSASLALVARQFPDPRRRAVAISAWAAAAGLGIAIGPIMAGLALRFWSWHSAFWLNLVICVVVVVLAVAFVPESRAADQRVDLLGQVLCVGGLSTLVFWLIEGGRTGYGDFQPLTAAGVGVLCFALFVVVELRHPNPMLDLRLMRDLTYSSSLLLAAAVMFGFVGVSLLEVLWMQRVRGLTALEVGFQMLAEFGPFIAASILSSMLVGRVGPRPLIAVGLFLAGVGAAQFALVEPTDTFAGYAFAFVVFGLGCGLANGPSTALAVGRVPRGKEGAASGTVNAARQVGSVLGTSVLGTLMTARLAEGLAVSPVSHASGVGAAVLLGGAVLALGLFAVTRWRPSVRRAAAEQPVDASVPA